MPEEPRSLAGALLGSIWAMPVLLGVFVGLVYWDGWEVGVYVLPLVIVHGALRGGNGFGGGGCWDYCTRPGDRASRVRLVDVVGGMT